jgi:hypothetical protein
MKTALTNVFQREIIAEIEAFVGPASVDGWDMEAIEVAVRR